MAFVIQAYRPGNDLTEYLRRLVQVLNSSVDVDISELEAAIVALQAELDAFQAEKGVANGLATLDGSALVPASQLPSYVDDVLEYANLAAFPVTGETGKIYVALDTGNVYRWSGSAYIQISTLAADSELLNGQAGTYYLDWTNFTNIPADIVNRNADTLDSQDGLYYLDWANFTGIPADITNRNADTLDGIDSTGFSLFDHNHTLDSLSNVTITANTSGELIKWSGTAWINNTLAEAGIEPAFTKNTAFNKDFAGTGVATTVARSDHNHDATYLGISATAANSQLLDNLDSTQFVRSDIADTVVDNHEFYTTDLTGSYTLSAIELREANLVAATQSAAAYAPALAFHWGGRVQQQIALHSDNKIVFRDGTTHAIDVTVAAGAFEENGTLLSAKYLGITAKAADSALLNAAAESTAASNNTIVKRTAAGYIYANYFNTTANVTTASPSHVFVETSSDSFIRKQTLANLATHLGVSSSSLYTLTGAAPELRFNETDAGTNLKNWNWQANAGVLKLTTLTDAFGVGSDLMSFTRSATTPLLAKIHTNLEITGEFTTPTKTPTASTASAIWMEIAADPGVLRLQTPAQFISNHSIATLSDISTGPAFSAYRATSNQTYSTVTELIFNAENFDTDADYSTSTGRFTPSAAGYYQINATMVISHASAVSGAAYIRKNSSTSNLARNRAINNATFSALDVSLSTVVHLNGTTDYVSVWADVSSGTASLIAETGCHFSGTFIKS